MASPTSCLHVLRRAAAGPLCRLFLALSLLMPATVSQAAAWRDIDGSYAITGADMLNPPEGARDDTHLRVQLRGVGARDLYRALPVTPVTDECTGGQMKQVGHMRCVYFENRRSYQCDFAVELATGRIEIGIPC